MIKFFKFFFLCITCFACSNSKDLETGEIKILEVLKNSIFNSEPERAYVDAKTILTRDKIDSINTPILYVELENGQNGTLTLYPNQGYGQTWLAADGATITFDRGLLIASRGMGDDIMAGRSQMPAWSKINNEAKYLRQFVYLSGNNQLINKKFKCVIKKSDHWKNIVIWGAPFNVVLFEEQCIEKNNMINNLYLIDRLGIVRKSYQYHSATIGYIVTERLER